MLALVLSHTAFVLLRRDPFIPNLFKAFLMKGCWILSNVFSASIEMLTWFISFFLLLQCIILCWFAYIRQSLHPGVKPASSWWMHSRCVVEFSLLVFCWEYLHLWSSGILVMVLLSCLCLVWQQSDAGLREWVQEDSFPLNPVESMVWEVVLIVL